MSRAGLESNETSGCKLLDMTNKFHKVLHRYAENLTDADFQAGEQIARQAHEIIKFSAKNPAQISSAYFFLVRQLLVTHDIAETMFESLRELRELFKDRAEDIELADAATADEQD